MSGLNVDIVTPEKLAFSGAASQVRVPGALGEFGVLPGHTLFLSLLRAGVATIVGPNGAQRVVLGRGFAEATAEKLVILTDSFEDGSSVDKEAAKSLLSHCEHVLATAAPGSDEFIAAQRDLELAQARLAV